MEQSTRVTNSGEQRTDGRQRDDALQLSGSTLIYVTDWQISGGLWEPVGTLQFTGVAGAVDWSDTGTR